MENTISQLFEIENKANQIINRAAEEKTRLHEEYDKEIIRMENEIFSDNQKKLKALQEQADIDLENETKLLIQNSEKSLKQLEEINSNKRDEFVSRVFDNIIHS